jgi:hypothetical protein
VLADRYADTALWVATPLQKQVFYALVELGSATVRELVEEGLLPDRETLIGYGVALSGLEDLGLVCGWFPLGYGGTGKLWEIRVR